LRQEGLSFRCVSSESTWHATCLWSRKRLLMDALVAEGGGRSRWRCLWIVVSSCREARFLRSARVTGTVHRRSHRPAMGVGRVAGKSMRRFRLAAAKFPDGIPSCNGYLRSDLQNPIAAGYGQEARRQSRAASTAPSAQQDHLVRPGGEAPLVVRLCAVRLRALVDALTVHHEEPCIAYRRTLHCLQ
jgi:hypothetical protein